MRGGALPLLFWASLLSVAGIINAIWTGDAIQIGTFAAAVLAVLIVALALRLRSPVAFRRGAPERNTGWEPVPHTSFAAVFTAVGLGVLLFGFVFGHFLVYLGAAIIIVGLGGWLRELIHQRGAAP